MVRNITPQLLKLSLLLVAVIFTPVILFYFFGVESLMYYSILFGSIVAINFSPLIKTSKKRYLILFVAALIIMLIASALIKILEI